MNISIFGTGYVGLVTGACLARFGNSVVCYDIDKSRIGQLDSGTVPFYEHGLEQIIEQQVAAKRLFFTDDPDDAVDHARAIFLCVGTPADKDGAADLTALKEAAVDIATRATGMKIVVIKSTVPVGTGDMLEERMRKRSQDFFLISNPEFLREGSAVRDFLHPDRVVIGGEDCTAMSTIEQLYESIVAPKIVLGRRAAEMCKYGANSYLAMRVSFINDLANICEEVGVDIDEVKEGMCSDTRVGSHFMWPGIGYGGSCFPKDVQALNVTAKKHGYTSRLLGNVHTVNQEQRQRFLGKILRYFGERVAGKKFGVWGVTFKHETDDIRESPAIDIVKALLVRGAVVHAYDPQGLGNLEREVAHIDLKLHDNAYDALTGCDALLVLTDWDEFRSPDFARMKKLLTVPTVFDGRNLWDAHAMKNFGFRYYSVGRGSSGAKARSCDVK